MRRVALDHTVRFSLQTQARPPSWPYLPLRGRFISSSVNAMLQVGSVSWRVNPFSTSNRPRCSWELLALAACDNIAVKISGACTLSHEPFPYADLWDPLFRIFDAFGFNRCMWGTDWTRAVALLTYKQGVDAFRVTDRLSDSDRAVLMGKTAIQVYNWSPAKT